MYKLVISAEKFPLTVNDAAPYSPELDLFQNKRNAIDKNLFSRNPGPPGENGKCLIRNNCEL